MRYIVRHLLYLPSLIFFTLALLAFFALPIPIAAEDQVLQAPGTIEEAKEGVLNIGDTIIRAIPKVVAGIWNTQVTPVWKKMGEWAQEEIWEKRVSPALQTAADTSKRLLDRQVEQRKPIIERELEKERQELKEDTKNATGGFWERFRALFRDRE